MTAAELVYPDYYDAEANAYRVGVIDRRRGNPRRVDLADRGPIATAYHTGYDQEQGT